MTRVNHDTKNKIMNWNKKLKFSRIDFALEFVNGLDFTEIRRNLTFLFDIKIKLITKQNMIYSSSLTYKYLM